MVEIFFYSSFIILIYTYIGYPLFLLILSRILANEVKRSVIYPKVALIIPVHNEAHQIGSKIKNCLQFDYPREKLKIVVVSDNSTDGTDNVVQQYLADGVSFIEISFRSGKVAAQNYAMMEFDSDIYIFTDAAIQMDPDCIKLIAENFNDEKVGVVSCKDMLVGESRGSEGEGNYIRYDMMVRSFASKFGSLIGVTGGFYAVRKQIAKGGWNPAFPPDFYIAMRCLKKGYRVIEDSRVNAYYRTTALEKEELPRKIRTLNRGMHALFSLSNIKLLNIFKYRMIAFELISHKVLRWLTPLLLIFMLISSLILSVKSNIWLLILLSQVIFYLVGLAVYFYEGIFSDLKPTKLIRYFMMANLAILIAWFQFISGKKYVMWQPTKR